MSSILVTVEQAAIELKLHPKTILRHIREGRLEATRIGKAYRIERAKLDAFAGLVTGADIEVRDIRTTTIVEISALDSNQTQSLAAFLSAAAMGAGPNTPRLQVCTAFDLESKILKIVVFGVPRDVARMLELIDLQIGGLK